MSLHDGSREGNIYIGKQKIAVFVSKYFTRVNVKFPKHSGLKIVNYQKISKFKTMLRIIKKKIQEKFGTIQSDLKECRFESFAPTDSHVNEGGRS